MTIVREAQNKRVGISGCYKRGSIQLSGKWITVVFVTKETPFGIGDILACYHAQVCLT